MTDSLRHARGSIILGLTAVLLAVACRGGDRADPDFRAEVANPAYASEGPRVLFDEAHNNHHRAASTYRPFTKLLEADGYTVYYAGGGIANDEIVEQIGHLQADKLVVFGAVAQTVPYTRLLIDRLHELGVCPDLQVIVGGGVFNRAEGLAEEIGADLWAYEPTELLAEMNAEPTRRMAADQRTVGRKRRMAKREAA